MWWGAALVFASMTAAILMLRATVENFLTLGVGNAFLMAAVACTWQGARTFEKREPQLWPVAAAPAFWFAVCRVPGFLATIEYRIALSSTRVATMSAAAGMECGRGRGEP